MLPKVNSVFDIKIVLCFTFILLFNVSTTAQETKPKPTPTQQIKPQNGYYLTSDLTEKPTYPGGMPEFYKFCGHFYKVPSTPTGIVIKGTIRVTFIVQKDGSLTDMEVVKDLGYGTGEEALRVLRLSQKWIPGKLNGQVVAAKFHLPISIQEPD